MLNQITNLENLTPEQQHIVNAYTHLETLILQGVEFPDAHTQTCIEFNLDERQSEFISRLYDAVDYFLGEGE